MSVSIGKFKKILKIFKKNIDYSKNFERTAIKFRKIALEKSQIFIFLQPDLLNSEATFKS